MKNRLIESGALIEMITRLYKAVVTRDMELMSNVLQASRMSADEVFMELDAYSVSGWAMPEVEYLERIQFGEMRDGGVWTTIALIANDGNETDFIVELDFHNINGSLSMEVLSARVQ